MLRRILGVSSAIRWPRFVRAVARDRFDKQTQGRSEQYDLRVVSPAFRELCEKNLDYDRRIGDACYRAGTRAHMPANRGAEGRRRDTGQRLAGQTNRGKAPLHLRRHNRVARADHADSHCLFQHHLAPGETPERQELHKERRYRPPGRRGRHSTRRSFLREHKHR